MQHSSIKQSDISCPRGSGGDQNEDKNLQHRRLEREHGGSECWQRPALRSTARLRAHCGAGVFMDQRRETRQREDVSQPQMESGGGEIKNPSQLTPVCWFTVDNQVGLESQRRQYGPRCDASANNELTPDWLTCDGRVAAGALLGIEAAEALDAVGTVPLWGEGLSGQRGLAARAQETLLVPDLVLVGHAAFSQSL